MAHHKSCIKRIKTSKLANQRNRAYRSEMRTEIRKLRDMQEPEAAQAQYKKVTSLLDRLVGKKILKLNAAANRKSALASHVAKLG